MDVTRVYAADITKAERDEKGNLLVYGTATSPAVDLDEQVCDPTWLKRAMPQWFKTAANVREQHSNIAAGVGVDLEHQAGDAWMLRSKIVDPVSIKKVEEGVLKGYSIGIRNAKIIKDLDAPGGRIVGGDIVEVSIVDSPCNPEALLTVAKSVGGVLTRVEEYTEGGETTVADVPDEELRVKTHLNKADGDMTDEADDITGAKNAIFSICDLLISEATELKNGRWEEIYDISLLMDAIGTLKRFLCREEQQAQGDDENDADVSYVSLADDADLHKAKYSAEDKRKMVSQGRAILNENGEPSYPIGDAEDLDNAIHAVGRGSGDHNAIRRHIIRSAKRLGASDKIPANWGRDGSLKASPAKADKPSQGKHKKHDVSKSVRTNEATFIAETIEKEVAKATKSAQESITALEAEVARLKSMPRGDGGPVLLRTQAPSNPQQTQAEFYLRKALTESDPELRRVWRAKAAELSPPR